MRVTRFLWSSSSSLSPQVSGLSPVDSPGIEPGSSDCQPDVFPLDHEPFVIQWTCRGVEPRSPGCKPGVFPLDEQPICFTSVDPPLPATLTSIQASCRWTGGPLLSLQYLSPCARHTPVCRARLRVRPGVEPGLPPYRGGVPPKTPTDRIAK